MSVSSRHLMMLLLIFAALPRFWALGEKSLWVDEAKSVQISRRYEDILPYCRNGNTPPLRYYMLHVLQKGQPPEAWVRLPSALASLACIVLLYFIAARLFNKSIAIVTAVLFAFSPWQIDNAQDARMYSVFLSCVLFSIDALFRAQESGRWRWWAYLGASMALGAYLSYFALWTSFIIVLYVLIARAIAWVKRADAGDFRNQLKSVGLLFALTIAGLVYLPWLWNVLRLVLSYNPPPEASAVPAVPLLNPFLTHFNLQYIDQFVIQMGCSIRLIAYSLLVLAIVGLITVWKTRRSFFLFCLLWFLVPLVILFFSNVRFFFPQRYLIYYHPVYLILVSVGTLTIIESVAAALSNALKQPIEKIRNTAIACMLIVVLGGFAYDTRDILRREKQDWRGAALYLAQHAHPGDTVITGQAWTEQALLFYLHPRPLGLSVVMHLYKLNELEEKLRTTPDVWYVSWGPLPAQVQQIVDRYLTIVKVLPGRSGDVSIYKRK